MPQDYEILRNFFKKAKEQFGALYDYCADSASPEIATRFTDAIVSYCESFETFPERGTLRDDVRPGLRITHHKKRTVIAFAVDNEAKQVSILGLFYGGQNFESLLQEDAEGFDNE